MSIFILETENILIRNNMSHSFRTVLLNYYSQTLEISCGSNFFFSSQRNTIFTGLSYDSWKLYWLDTHFSFSEITKIKSHWCFYTIESWWNSLTSVLRSWIVYTQFQYNSITNHHYGSRGRILCKRKGKPEMVI